MRHACRTRRCSDVDVVKRVRPDAACMHVYMMPVLAIAIDRFPRARARIDPDRSKLLSPQPAPAARKGIGP